MKKITINISFVLIQTKNPDKNFLGRIFTSYNDSSSLHTAFSSIKHKINRLTLKKKKRFVGED